MTALVVSGALITYDQVVVTDTITYTNFDGPSDAELRARLEEIEEKKGVVAAALKSLRKRISDMQHTIKENNADAEQEVNELMRKIRELQEMIRQKTLANAEADPDDLDAEFAQFDSEHESSKQRQHDSYRSHQIFDSEEEEVEESPEAKRLFRLIAQRTHPDRTDDPELHMLFLSAKECRRLGDMDGLKEIWALLQNAASHLLNRLLRQVEEERQALYELQAQLAYMKNGIDYKVLQAYEADKFAVIEITAKNIAERIMQLRAHLTMLQRLTGTYKPPPKFLTFDFG